MSAALAQSEPRSEGMIKSFGKFGPLYEVLGTAATGSKGEMVRIRVISSGELLDYPMADMLVDPLVP